MALPRAAVPTRGVQFQHRVPRRPRRRLAGGIAQGGAPEVRVDDDPGGVDRRHEAGGRPAGQESPRIVDQSFDADRRLRPPPLAQRGSGPRDGIARGGDDEAPWIRGERPVGLKALEERLDRRELPEGRAALHRPHPVPYFRSRPRPNPTRITTATTQTIRSRS